jgi:hypothetical protein
MFEQWYSASEEMDSESDRTDSWGICTSLIPQILVDSDQRMSGETNPYNSHTQSLSPLYQDLYKYNISSFFVLDTARIKGKCRKFSPPWKGPGIVLERLTPYIYEIKLQSFLQPIMTVSRHVGTGRYLFGFRNVRLS